MDLAREDATSLVIHPIHGPGLVEALAEHAHVSLVTPDNPSDVVGSLTESGALVTFAWDDDFLVPALRWVQAISAGMEQFPAQKLQQAGVILTSATGVHTPSVAEHALALTWALVRRLGPAIRRMDSRAWITEKSTELRHLKAAVLGVGSIGSEIAALLEAIGVDVVGVNTSGVHNQLRRVVAKSGLMSVCREVDVIICALPDTLDTHHLLGSAHFEALDGWVVNVGRGSTIDEVALVEALERGVMRGAALDVTEIEPLPAESPLWEMENVIITSHTAWATDQLATRLADLIAHNARAFIGQGDWRNRVL